MQVQKNVIIPTPPHPIPCDVNPKCRITHVCKCQRTSSSPAHPTLSHVMCAQSVESHMCASAKERHHPHPTPPYPMWCYPKCRISHVCKCQRTSSSPAHPTLSHVMCAQSVESHMCASANERQHPHPTPPYPMWFVPKVTQNLCPKWPKIYALSDPLKCKANVRATSPHPITCGLCPKWLSFMPKVTPSNVGT